jgi:RND family efflux transporter MFP subunit
MKRFISRTLACAAACVLAGCGSKPENAVENSTRLPSVQIRVQTVERQSRTMTDEVVGTVRAKLHATLEARLSGRIEEMPVALGAPVQKGQLIARLDADEVAARLEQAKAALEEADRNWKRMATLFEQQSVTRAEYDSAQARQRIAKGAVDEAQAMMGYVAIVAPFNGVVAKKWADVGDLATPGKPLVDIEDPSVLQMEADVPEAMAAHIRQDSQLGVRVGSIAGELTGAVSEIAPVADPNSRTFRVKLNLPPTAGLMPGQFARLAVPIGEVSAIRVPAAAVIQRGQMEIVFVVVNGHAQLRLVKTGKRIGDERELVSGLNSGESIVTEGAPALADGQPVTVQP